MDQGNLKSDGGLAALLDFGFTKFVTLGVVKVLYLLGMGLIGLWFLAILITGFSFGGVMGVLGALIVGPIIALIQLLFLRIYLELVVVMFRIAENTGKMVELQGGKPASTGTTP